jgi:hypothetical protein
MYFLLEVLGVPTVTSGEMGQTVATCALWFFNHGSDVHVKYNLALYQLATWSKLKYFSYTKSIGLTISNPKYYERQLLLSISTMDVPLALCRLPVLLSF